LAKGLFPDISLPPPPPHWGLFVDIYILLEEHGVIRIYAENIIKILD
jgi:hypothetical protein